MQEHEARKYGAKGDGLAKDTSAIQQAIDACHAAGGGTVVLSAGTYLSGTIVMKDHVTLRLDAGSTLRASTDREDYLFPVQYEGKFAGVSYPVLIYGKNAHHIAISGSGTLDGQDERFWTPKKQAEGDPRWESRVKFWSNSRHLPGGWRPMMVNFERCRDVAIRDVTFERSPCYAVWLIDCERVRIQSVSVQHHFHGPNTDGFHLSSCRFVRISDCDFHTGDDSIAIDGDGSYPAEHIAISNCTFQTLTNMCRLFTGIDPWHKEADATGRETVRHVTIANCSVRNAAGGINIVAKHGTVEHIQISNLTLHMELPGVPIFIMSDRGKVRNVSIQHVTAEANGVCSVVGNPGDVIEGIRLSDCHFEVRPMPKTYGAGYPDPLPGYSAYHEAPYGMYLRHVGEIALHNVSVKGLDELPELSWSALRASDVDRLEINGFSADCGGADPRMPVIHVMDVRRADVDRCRAPGRSGVYLLAEGMAEEALRLGASNDFSRMPVREAPSEEAEEPDLRYYYHPELPTESKGALRK